MNGRRLAPLVAISVLLALLTGCNGESGSGAPTAGAAPDTATRAAEPASAPVVEGAHSVRCGCSLEDVGTCGNYVEFEGAYVELAFPEDLDPGEMAFCGQDDLMAKVEGEMSDGRFVVSSFEYVE